MTLTMFHEGECAGCGRAGEMLLGSRGLCDRCMVERYTGEVGADTIAVVLGCYARARDGEQVTIADLDAEAASA